MLKRHLLGLAVVVSTGAVAGMLAASGVSTAGETDPHQLVSDDPTGQMRTFDVNGALDVDNPFFKDLGTNGRTCFSCHRPAQGWTITPESVQDRFAESRGLDPIFRTNDGSNCEGADVSTVGKRQAAFSQLLNRGLIRVGIDVPAGAEFVIDRVDDPYNCGVPLTAASMYRRPLPSTNLRFLSAVMWDGRESSAATTILQDLAKQADDATQGHAQASLHLTPQEAQAIVALETGLFTAQARDDRAGSLHADGATGGPIALSQQPFFIGINDPVGLNPTGAPFDSNAFTLFNAWAHADDDLSRAQRAIRSRPADLQHEADCDLGGSRAQQPDLLERRHGARAVHRHVHDVSRRAECGRPLGQGTPEHRPRRCRAPDGGPAALYAAPHLDRRHGEDDRSRPGDDHRQVGRRREVQGSDPAGAGRARAVLPQRLRRNAR